MSKFLRRLEIFVCEKNVIEALTTYGQASIFGAQANQVTSSKKNYKKRKLDNKKHFDKPSEQKKFRAEEVKHPKLFVSRLTYYIVFRNTPKQVLLSMEPTISFIHHTPIQMDIVKRNSTKFCHFHKEVGHDTNDCFNLKEKIKDLIKIGLLREFIRGQRMPQVQK